MSTCALACAVTLAPFSATQSADRPGLLQRTVFRAKPKTPSNAEVPPLPEKSTLPSPSRALDVDIPKANTKAGPEAVGAINTATLKRFPHAPVNEEETAISGPSQNLTLGLDEKVTPIDLPAALKLANWNSPEVLLAQQQVLSVTAQQQYAAAQALPDLNLGTTFDSHTGALQSSSGQILNLQRSSMYLGAGGNAVGSGTVNIPGLQYNLNVGESYFAYLVSRQQSERARAGAAAVRNNVLLQVASAYCQLVKAQGTRAIALQARNDAVEVARITRTFAKIGQGRPADAERARTEVGRRDADVFSADAAIIDASTRLGEILNLESSVRLQSSESWIVPRSIVPDPIPLPELIAIALYQRPEIADRRAQVHAAMLELESAKLLIFSPQFIAGFSDGAFGGGSSDTSAAGNPRFGEIADRTDVDIVMYWSIRNLGLANRALIKAATARMAATDWERTKQLNQIREQVAAAYARTQASAAQLEIRERAVDSSERGFREDLKRTFAGEGRPIEVLDNLRLRALAQQDYLDIIAEYNQAHYELYVAIGQPPAALLIHTAPAIVPPSPAMEPK